MMRVLSSYRQRFQKCQHQPIIVLTQAEKIGANRGQGNIVASIAPPLSRLSHCNPPYGRDQLARAKGAWFNKSFDTERPEMR